MSSAPVQTPSSGAPILIDAVPDYVVDQKWFYEPLTYNLNDYFKDPDGGPLTYTAKILDPAWAAQGISTIDFGFQITESGVLQIGVDYGWSFTFGPSQYTQKTYHTPQIQNPVEIQVTATDADGHSVSDIFGLSQKSDELGLTNRAPVFEHDRDTDVAPQSFVVHEVGGINIGGRWFHAGWWQRQEIGNFEDPDGEKLTLTATLADGSPLPSWLHLTSEQDRTSTKAILWVSGAEDTDIGSYDIRITATDAAGASATHETSFTLFPKSNQAPTFISYPTLHTSGFFEDLRKVSLDVANGESFVQDVSAFFYDHDGDVLTYSLASATGQDIPAWLSINATTGVMTVTPGAEDRGFYEVKVLASDPFGAKVTSHTMEFSVAAPNRAPVLDQPLPDIAGAIGQGLQTVNIAGHFSDVDRYFGDASLDDRLSFVATLADGSPLPGWMTFLSDGTLEFRSVDNADAGTFDIRVTAYDRQGTTTSDVFTLTMAAKAANAPFVSTDLPDYWVALHDNPLIDSLGSYFSDPQGGALTFSATLADGSALPDWLSVSSDGSLSLTSRDKANIGTATIMVTATDGQGLSVSEKVTLTLSETPNRAPELYDDPALFRYGQDHLFWNSTYFTYVRNPAEVSPGQTTFTDMVTIHELSAYPAAWELERYGTAQRNLERYFFSDPDRDDLTYSVAMVDGGAWPEWLSIDQYNNLKVAQVDEADQLERTVRITATDAHGAQISGTMTIVLEHLRNHAPELERSPSYVRDTEILVLENQLHSYGLMGLISAVDPDGDPLSYSLEFRDGTAAPSWIATNSTGLVWVLSDQAVAGRYELDWVVSDPDGLTLRLPTTVTVTVPEAVEEIAEGETGTPPDPTVVLLDYFQQQLDNAPSFAPDQFDPLVTLENFVSGLASLMQKPDGSWLVHTRGSGSEATFEAPTIRFGDHEYQLSLEGMQSSGFQTTELRDFDGNNLGANEAWELMGFGDVDGDGVLQYLLTNPELGRWATVNGDMNTGDHGAGGASRVVGIYIDPFVQDGKVELGSAFDSQTRFTNDLKSNNLIALGNIDGDGDGYQDVFFRTNDGTAYLRAVMHADGNIQYANYMVWDQLTDWMSQNQVDSGFYDDWQNL